jgi:predicted NBD/HSP70 family sugar kinase
MRPPATQRALRRQNLGTVLQHVVRRGPRSRATIAQETGFNKSTVSSLVTELIELGLLAERGAERTGTVGRPGLVVEVAGAGAAGIGLEVNVDYLSVRIVDLAGDVRHKAHEPVDLRGRRADEMLDRLAAIARTALEHLRQEEVHPAGITVALPGLVDAASGTLLVAPNLHWDDLPVAAELARRLGPGAPPITADNDANLAALAELRSGAAEGLRDFVHVTGEVGIGAGIVIGGELFRGAHGYGGEFGHVTVEADGLPCACGSVGCLETRVGLEALLRASADGSEPEAATGFEPVERLAARADAGDERARAALAEGGRWLGVALASTANLVDPQAFILGGFFAPLAEHLAPAAEAELRLRVLGAGRGLPALLKSQLGPEGAVCGAAGEVLERVMADPAIVAA